MKLLKEGARHVVAEGIALTDAEAMTVTLWGEGRSEPVDGRIAIGSVIRNRLHTRRWGNTYAKVCLWPWAFSCWRREGGLHNYEATLEMAKALAMGRQVEDPILRECAWIAHGIIGEWLQDRVAGATHYFSPQAMPKGKVPAWAMNQTPVLVLGEHIFYARIA